MFLAAWGLVQPSYVVANSWMITMISFTVTRTILNLRRYNSAPALRSAHNAETRMEAYDVGLTLHVPVDGTLVLRSRNDINDYLEGGLSARA